MDKFDEFNLKRRYLLWLYKTTKEAFDKYERKFIQLDIDEEILQEIEKELKGAYLPHEKKALGKYLNEFRLYINQKENTCLKLKYKGKRINPELIFLDLKLNAIEKIIAKELGKELLQGIKESYQQEMLKRIIEEKEAGQTDCHENR